LNKLQKPVSECFCDVQSHQDSTLIVQSVILTSVVLEQKGYFFLGEICILYDAKIVMRWSRYEKENFHSVCIIQKKQTQS